MKQIGLFTVLIISLLLLAGCTKRPEITSSMIDYAVDLTCAYDHVQEAAISVKGGDISMAVVVSYSASVDYARGQAEGLVRGFGSAASIYNKELAGPTKDSYGEIYKTYDVLIKVVRPDGSALLTGAKSRNANNIKW